MVIGLTNEPMGLVEKFVSDTKATHPIVIENGDSLRAYGGTGFPTIVLIGADGKVVATGGIGDAQIEEALQKVFLPPKLTGKAAVAQPFLDKRKYAAARKALDAVAADEKAPAEDRSSAQAALAWIDETGKRQLESAAADAAKGDAVAAAETYERVAESFKGLPQADDAGKALADLFADPAKKKEIDAAKRWEVVKEKIAGEKPKKAIPVVRGFLSSFKGTKAAAEAQKVLDTLEAQTK